MQEPFRPFETVTRSRWQRGRRWVSHVVETGGSPACGGVFWSLLGAIVLLILWLAS
jgi:hypothetical protein